jgi:hypothetical protein
MDKLSHTLFFSAGRLSTRPRLLNCLIVAASARHAKDTAPGTRIAPFPRSDHLARHAYAARVSPSLVSVNERRMNGAKRRLRRRAWR